MTTNPNSLEHEKWKGENYKALRDQLEAENEMLMRQRKELQQKKIYPNVRSQGQRNLNTEPSAIYEEEERESESLSPGRNGRLDSRTQIIKGKIREIIGICNGESNNTQNSDLKEIVDAEQQILNYLDNIQSRTQYSRPKTQDSLSPNKNTRLNIRSEVELKGFRQSIGDDAMEMIEEIQRKALIQIETLRSDKISLMNRLNSEARAFNEEKKVTAVLEKQVSSLINQLERLGINVNLQQIEHSSFPTFSKRGNPPPQVNARKPQQNIYPNRPHSSLPLEARPDREEISLRKLHSENSRINNPEAFKNELKEELNFLTGKIKNYESILANQQGGSYDELDHLYHQGNSLNENGERLMRIKSKPEFRKPNDTEYMKEVQFLKNRINLLEKQNESIKGNKFSPSIHESKKIQTKPSFPIRKVSSFSPSQYEGIISEMKRATYE